MCCSTLGAQYTETVMRIYMRRVSKASAANNSKTAPHTHTASELSRARQTTYMHQAHCQKTHKHTHTHTHTHAALQRSAEALICPVCSVCPVCPVCSVCPVYPVCPVCSVCPVCPVCPVCSRLSSVCPVCPVCPVCSSLFPSCGLT